MSFFGVNIKKIRQVKGLSQKAFADLFELNRGVISAYEEGRAEPKIETVLKVAHYFSLDLDDFLTKTLQVNHLVSSSNIDSLMFVHENNANSKENQISAAELSASEKLMQKILASSDLVYEFKSGSSKFSHYQTGDILFLRETQAQNENPQTLYILKNDNLQMLTEPHSKKEKVYKIVGYFSFEQKNILSGILERIERLENMNK